MTDGIQLSADLLRDSIDVKLIDDIRKKSGLSSAYEDFKNQLPPLLQHLVMSCSADYRTILMWNILKFAKNYKPS